MSLSENIFKTYDIRGISPDELSPDVAYKVGMALSDFLDEGKIAVGRDMRNDSAALAKGLIEGLIHQGREVIDIGMVTSDMIYFAVGKYSLSGGAMITASHNPGQYNGIKLTARGVHPIGVESGLMSIKEKILADDFKKPAGNGKRIKKDILDEWVDHAFSFADTKLKPLKIGVDGGNGMVGPIIERFKKNTSLKIHGLYLKPDGNFPNHPADPLQTKNLADLISLVKKEKLDVGIAFDGDGDRAFLVDENGEPITTSLLITLIAQNILVSNPGGVILYDAVCSRIVPETVEHCGGEAIRTKVGHSFVKADMHRFDGLFGGEHSGHFYFKDNFCADSGLIAAITILSILSRSSLNLSQIIQPFKKYFSSGEINLEVIDQQSAIKKISQKYGDGKQDRMDGLSVDYKNWWFNIRASNTEPLIRLNVESIDPKLTQTKTQELLKIIRG